MAAAASAMAAAVRRTVAAAAHPVRVRRASRRAFAEAASSSRALSTSSHAHAAAASASASSSKTAAPAPPRQIDLPLQRPNITDPRSFLEAISRGKSRQLQDNNAALTALGESWEDMWAKTLDGVPRQPAATAELPPNTRPLRRSLANAGPAAAVGGPSKIGTPLPAASARAGKQINKALRSNGVPVKDRRYILWALEKYRQGRDPVEFAIRAKPKKKIRGWGPRVQNGIRVRGRRRPGEK